MRFCMQTPQHIKDETEIDVFEELIPDTDLFYAAKRTALWAFYRYRGIGYTDYDYWLQCLKDRYAQIKEKYDIKFQAWTDWLQAQEEQDTTSFDDFSSVSTAERSDLPDTPIVSPADNYLSETTRVTYKTGTGQDSEKVSRWIEAVPNPSEDFAREFRDQFSIWL